MAKTSVYKGYKQDKIEMRGDRAEMSDFPLYLNTVAVFFYKSSLFSRSHDTESDSIFQRIPFFELP
ncbi:MAG: hypothetical protein BHV90_04810 [Clostridiales bacterium 42_27]|nr:MAG: hypothetical protein BHV90_04810 [Clostridiales bacterium 42_27]